MASHDLQIIRERIDSREESLSPWATRESQSKGRNQPEEPSFVRGEYQRDRDKIIHTNSFRRLKHKSQVLIAPRGDHFTTRLTHVMEVAQIGRTIARALNMNEDLVEAAALGHDLGHTPFGHIGEKVLNRLLPNGFHHSRHSVRIITLLEKNGRGLNLTYEVIEAIKRHSKPEGDFILRSAVEDLSLEAQIVRMADALAYLTHDVNDAIRAGSLRPEDFPKDIIEVLGYSHSERVNTLIVDVIVNSLDCAGSKEPKEGKPWIRMSLNLADATTALRNFMFEHSYHPTSDSEAGRKAAQIVELLFIHFKDFPEEIPQQTRAIAHDDLQAAADYVCGMTDNFALMTAERLEQGISDDILKGRI